jgi:hypothetical protein
LRPRSTAGRPSPSWSCRDRNSPTSSNESVSRNGRVIELAITRDELSSTNRAFLDITTRHMELTLEDPTIMTGYIRSAPVALFFAVRNARNVSSLEFDGHDFLGSHDFLRPPFNHRYAPVHDSFWLSHEWLRLLSRVYLCNYWLLCDRELAHPRLWTSFLDGCTPLSFAILAASRKPFHNEVS